MNYDPNPHASPEEEPQDNTSSENESSPYPPFFVQPIPSVKPTYRGRDALFAWLSIAVGFLFVRTMPLHKTTLGALLFFLLLYAFGGAYLRLSGIRLDRSVYLLAGGTAILSLGMITGGNAVIRGFLAFFLLLSFLFWIYCVARREGEHVFGDALIACIFRALFVLPFASLDHIFRSLFAFPKKGEKTSHVLRSVGWALLGLGVAVIPTAVIVLLLSYDESFTKLLEQIFSFSMEGAWELIRDLILGFLSAILLFSALFAVKWRRERTDNSEKPKGINTHVFPKALLCAAVTPILAVYVIFFISQWDYYVSAFTHVLPGDLTYAAYAREGFFQLCTVCALNAVFLLLFHLLMRRSSQKRDVIKSVYSTVISVFTLILIATAMAKMMLYIESYGLTQKRVYSSWLMLTLAIMFILVLIATVLPKMRMIPALVLTAVLCFGLIAIPDVDGMIASYNVDAYLEGDLATVDVDLLADYGSPAVPALVKLRDTLSKRPATPDTDALLKRADAALATVKRDLEKVPDSFFYFNIPDARARALLKE